MNFNQTLHHSVSNLIGFFHCKSLSQREEHSELNEKENAEKAREEPWSGTLGTFGPLRTVLAAHPPRGDPGQCFAVC